MNPATDLPIQNLSGAQEERKAGPEEVVVATYRRMFFTFGGLTAVLAACLYVGRAL